MGKTHYEQIKLLNQNRFRKKL